jgi:type I restriction enzyme S subunit
MSEYSYKGSGIQWLGEIPNHWKPMKLKKLIKLIPSNVDKRTEDDETPVKLCNYVDVYYNDVIDLSIEFMSATANDTEMNRFQLIESDVIITKDSEAPHDIAVPAYVKETEDKLLCGYHLSILRNNSHELNNQFLFWALKDEKIASQLHREATGITRWAIGSKHVKNSIIALPPSKEQKAIADYLEKACAKIDRVIEMKKEQIRKIQSHLTSKFHEVLTYGLRDEELYDPEINWLNRVPKSWERKRLKDIVNLKSGNGITSESIFPEGDYPVYGGNGLRGYTFEYTHEGYFPLIGRQGALCGNINYAEGKFFASEHAVVARPRRKVDIFWIGEFMRMMNLNQYSNAAAQPGLAVERVKNLYIPVPDYEEQVELALYLKEYKGKIDKHLDLLKSQLEIVIDFKKSFIHECVTGKKKVFEGEPERLKAEAV